LQFANLQWKDEPKYHQESETGQIIINLKRHKNLLYFGLFLFSDKKFFQYVFYGDKNIFKFIFFFTKMPFYFIQHYPGYSSLYK
jgi:hypothetical protein